MNRYLLSLFLLCPLSVTVAQEINLSDSVIYVDKKPVAFYYKTLNETMPHYNMTVYGLNRKLLMKAEVLKFEAPVHELKPFYYYELTFPPLADTLTFYAEDEAFSLVLSKLIRDYKLISNNELDKAAVTNFKTAYPGGPALLAKVKYYEDYLIETRNFNQQVIRDRTKPVTIKNDRSIIQDGKIIGRLVQEVYTAPNPVLTETIRWRGQEMYPVSLANGSPVDVQRYGGGDHMFTSNKTMEYGDALFKISFPKIKSKPYSYETQLRRICYLIENFAL